MLPVVCLETRVFMGSYVGREGGRLVCYWHRVLLAPSCVPRVRERVATVYIGFIVCMGGDYRQFVFSEFEAAECYRGTVHVRTAKRHGTVRARHGTVRATDI